MSPSQLHLLHDAEAAWARIKPHVVPAFFMASVLIGLYLVSLILAPGWITYLFSSIALALIAVTALARVNDITMEHTAPRWQIRRLGLVMTGAAAIMLILSPFFAINDWPSWREVMLRWGVALTWLTTPHMPPWYRYISGKYRTVQQARVAAVAADVTGLDPKDDAPIYPQEPLLPPDVPYDRRRHRNEETGP